MDANGVRRACLRIYQFTPTHTSALSADLRPSTAFLVFLWRYRAYAVSWGLWGVHSPTTDGDALMQTGDRMEGNSPGKDCYALSMGIKLGERGEIVDVMLTPSLIHVECQLRRFGLTGLVPRAILHMLAGVHRDVWKAIDSRFHSQQKIQRCPVPVGIESSNMQHGPL